MRGSITVIIPCYRSHKTVERAVLSVIKQTLFPSEIILVDDFSDDDGKTLSKLQEIVEKYNNANIKIIKLEKNLGPGGARNVAWNSSTQDYIAFLDADDTWTPEKLKIQYSWMLAHPKIDLTAHKTHHIKAQKKFYFKDKKITAQQITKQKLLITNCCPTRTVMLKRNLSYRFISDKRYSEDYHLWLSIVLGGYGAYLLDVTMACSYKHDYGESGLTGHLYAAQKGELDTYSRLYKDEKISYLYCKVLKFSSWLKFLRRYVLTYSRNII